MKLDGGLILVVDDEKRVRDSVRVILEDEGFSVLEAQDGETAFTRIAMESPDVVLLDIWMPGIDGLDVLKVIKEQDESLPVVIMSGHGNIESAVKATKLGAYDFLEKPLSIDRLTLVLRNALNQRNLLEENRALRDAQETGRDHIGGTSPAIRDILEHVEVVAPTNASILITGENGTGKELLAKEIHAKSRRRTGPFAAVNCAAIPETLIESELFGHERGAFTGATSRKMGRFDLAHNGTLFLDEVGDMNVATQAKILRVLEEKAFQRVGGNRDIVIDVRIIAATNRDLEEMIREGTFREDLYFRLNVFPFYLPPLRERRDDIPSLLEKFLRDYSLLYGKKGIVFSPAALEALRGYYWPGNVRELRNVVERLVILAREDTIDLDLIPLSIKETEPPEAPQVLHDDLPDYRKAKERFEREFLSSWLAKNDWNITKTSEQVGLERSNLHRKIKQLGLINPEKGSRV
ncbi:MAG: sigma-54-dependent Fis family transcriptional regulator [bacterium]|nr:MAG: sigma-54-dependent Fis family transcriptional regulator [bacterium]